MTSRSSSLFAGLRRAASTRRKGATAFLWSTFEPTSHRERDPNERSGLPAVAHKLLRFEVYGTDSLFRFALTVWLGDIKRVLPRRS